LYSFIMQGGFVLFVCFGCSVFADLLWISASTDLSYEDSILWPFCWYMSGQETTVL
jgi:hypothetical protein